MRRKVVQTRARLGRSVPGSEPKICTSSSGGSSRRDIGARPFGPTSAGCGAGLAHSMRSVNSSSSAEAPPPPPASSGSVSVSGSLSPPPPRRCSRAAPRRRQPRAGPTPHSRAHTAMAAACLRRGAWRDAARRRRTRPLPDAANRSRPLCLATPPRRVTDVPPPLGPRGAVAAGEGSPAPLRAGGSSRPVPRGALLGTTTSRHRRCCHGAPSSRSAAARK